jgi:SAM-dependent methyltransferase
MTVKRTGAATRDDAPDQDTRTREVLRLFEAKAVTWPAKYAPGGPLASRLASLSDAVSRYARAGDRILDLGCGTGELVHALAVAGFRVTGCDISPQMLHAACDRGGSARWVRLEPDWRRLPFVSAEFDVIVSASVLEYAAEPGVLLGECARVLRPGGVMLYTVPNLRHPIRWAEWFAQRLVRLIGMPSAGGRRSRWHEYHAYLRTSLQRHPVRWWVVASWGVGLRPVLLQADSGQSALRLLAFARAAEPRAFSVGAAEAPWVVRR